MRSRQRCKIVGIGSVQGVTMKVDVWGESLSRKLRRGVRTSANLGFNDGTCGQHQTLDVEIGESIAVTTAIARQHASLGYQDGRKGSGMSSPTHPLPHSINSVLTITTERRRSLCPPVQVPHLPLLQLVGFFKRHERLPQILPPRIRKAQSSDGNLRQPTTTPPPRNYRKLHQRRTTVNMCEEPAE
jgi:hypothetical protein